MSLSNTDFKQNPPVKTLDSDVKSESLQQLDAWQVGKEIGRGGMGIVFEAFRADGQYQQKAAIKITPAFASEEELKRFHLERQILAQLQHPNIATLLDGGSTEDNRPYLVMEYIDGVKLTDYIEKHQLDLKQRLALFVSVCKAVQFAHEQDVIHRDLKPENIMVSEDGQVKLLDFGVSKIALADNATRLTGMYGMTLAYASPEQIKGERSTTASDIYSLGVILYYLLCQEDPLRIDPGKPEESFAKIINETPIKPSAMLRVMPKGLPWSIHADLDNIAGKALRKKPQHRYFCVADMRNDIECYLQGKPVSATPPGWFYRSNKFVRRHPVSVALSTALFSAVMVGLTVSLNLTFQLTKERDNLLTLTEALENEVDTSNEVIELLTGIFKAAKPTEAKSRQVDVLSLVDIAARQTQNRLANRPEVKARLLRTLGRVQQLLGQYEPGLALLEQAQSLDDTQDSYVLAQLSEGYRFARMMEKAKSLLEQLDLQKVADPFKRSEINRIIGEFYRENNQPKLALPYFQDAHRYWKNLGGEKGDFHIAAQMNLAMIHKALFEYDKALELSLSAEKAVVALHGEQHPNNIRIQSWLSSVYQNLGDTRQAVTRAKSAYEFAQKIYGPNSRYYNDIVTHLSNSYYSRGQYQMSLDLLELELKKSLDSAAIKGFYLSDKGAMNYALGRYDEAVVDFAKAIDILQPLYKGNIAYLHSNYLYRGLSLGSNGQLDAGIRVLDEGYTLATKAWGEDSFPAESFSLAKIQLSIIAGTQQGMEETLLKINNIFEQAFPAGHEGRLAVYRVMADFYLAQQDWLKANEVLDIAIEIANQAWDQQTVGRLLLELKSGQALWYLGQKDEAKEKVMANALLLQRSVGEQSVYYDLAERLKALVL